MILLGDCLERLKELPDNSVDSVVTDPPYGWRFMGKAWDDANIMKMAIQGKRPGETYVGADGCTRKTRNQTAEAAGKYDLSLSANQAFQVFTENYCRELMRVLKPGGHMLIFCGPRTYHRMASGVEDAGFEIRDQLQWLFGSGFPKSHDISKGIDKAAGAEREVIGLSPNDRPKSQVKGGKAFDSSLDHGQEHATLNITAPSTDAAKQWQGWGSALKPANEPIVLARKPLSESTLAKNVLRWGVGGLNIDASRIATEEIKETYACDGTGWWDKAKAGFDRHNGNGTSHAQGRWPANLILDEQAAFMLDEQSGHLGGCGNKKTGQADDGECSTFGIGGRNGPTKIYDRGGGASRFFYCAKSSKSERNAGLEGMPEKEVRRHGDRAPDVGRQPQKALSETNNHPTVKPLKLMEYLIKLITPPGGTVLDPFMGSGSTGVAAFRLGFKFIGCEMNEEYVEIAKKRIEHAKEDSAS